ncbi:DnaJ-domain-containing protein [Xylariomycetidae sp. FL2044]|nr:DnaJ-domain-containing protein [Xylariomycetidae sp. FL2044]
MANRPPPNYYAILEVTETATTQQIRDAYKRAALKCHPDRVPADSAERPARTRKFQLVNDAYYTLSDASRRREYDAQRRLFGGAGPSSSSSSRRPNASYNADPFGEAEDEFETGPTPDPAGAGPNNFYSWAWNFFTKGGGGGGNAQGTEQARQRTEEEQFGDVFEEMLREEGMDEAQNSQNKGGKMWSLAGGAAGGILGFIAANFPGALAGMVAGNRFGAIRDARGKSVYAVFQELPYDDRARLLAQLATRVFSHAVGV